MNHTMTERNIACAEANFKNLLEKANDLRKIVVERGQHPLSHASGMNSGWARQLDEALIRLEGAYQILNALGFRVDADGKISRFD